MCIKTKYTKKFNWKQFYLLKILSFKISVYLIDL